MSVHGPKCDSYLTCTSSCQRLVQSLWRKKWNLYTATNQNLI